MMKRKKIKVKAIIITSVGMIFIGGLLFVLDFLGICDISSVLHFHKREKSRKKRIDT